MILLKIICSTAYEIHGYRSLKTKINTEGKSTTIFVSIDNFFFCHQLGKIRFMVFCSKDLLVSESHINLGMKTKPCSPQNLLLG